MAKKSEKRRKVSFSKEDAAALAERYDSSTVLTLLQEISNYPQAKFDWNELVKKTSTGICNAGEYQMVWRHLAYGHALLENVAYSAQPLDDDSDLECEREAIPHLTKETASEAAACVKVMIASHRLSESTPSSSVIKAPLTINVPVCGSSKVPIGSSQPFKLMQETNIIFPVTVERQTRPNVSSKKESKGKKTNGSVSGNTFIKKERKAWSEEEDKQLRAAVQRWGEGNWADMAKRDNFQIQRSPSQLSKRWGTLRKKEGGIN